MYLVFLAGISIINKRLLGHLPGTVPATAEDCKTVLAASQVHMGALQHMLSAAALSLADALLERYAHTMGKVYGPWVLLFSPAWPGRHRLSWDVC
jgi:hypothetical protein